MNTARARMRQRWAALIGFTALVAVFACNDYRRTNPFDPEVRPESLHVVVVGPDTLFTIGQTAEFTLGGTPVFTDPTERWAASNRYELDGEGTGTFDLFTAPLYPATDAVEVTVGIGHYITPNGASAWIRTFFKEVVVTQRLVRIQLRCPDTHACDAQAAGGTWSIWADGFDKGDREIVGMEVLSANPARGTPIASFASRDPSIAAVAAVGIRAANVSALRSGTTWIVATRVALADTLRDSLQVVVP
ncbi:MAG TPA: hypothetical protein VGI97_07830 [Gemmatimonadaceae bacterium]